MNRPAWQKLQQVIRAGQIKSVVIWHDLLGRTASALCTLFEELQSSNVRLISLKDSIDLGTASGRMLANVLASMAAYETKLKSERVKAGQDAARASGKKWGGSQKGRRIKVTDEQAKIVKELKARGEKIAAIARAVSLSRLTVYRILEAK
jgi:DNA invertase Pin-like site-specific DNA recombinase